MPVHAALKRSPLLDRTQQVRFKAIAAADHVDAMDCSTQRRVFDEKYWPKASHERRNLRLGPPSWRRKMP